MLIKSEPCPWCGQEIESPHLTRGTCEHCSKPYRPVILLYNRYRTRRSEVPLLQAYAFYIITFLMFLYIAVRNSLRRSGIDFISIVFVVLSCFDGRRSIWLRSHLRRPNPKKSTEYQKMKRTWEMEKRRALGQLRRGLIYFWKAGAPPPSTTAE